MHGNKNNYNEIFITKTNNIICETVVPNVKYLSETMLKIRYLIPFLLHAHLDLLVRLS